MLQRHRCLAKQDGPIGRVLGSHEQARAIYERLARENPTVAEFGSALAGSHINIGLLQVDMGRLTEAIQSYEQARAIRERLVARTRRRADFRATSPQPITASAPCRTERGGPHKRLSHTSTPG